MVLFNGLNYFEHLLIMSLNVQQYKFVGRSFINRMLSNQKECECGCKYCYRIKKIKEELKKNGFETFNKKVQ